MIFNKLQTLKLILEDRLEHMDRWNRVGIFFSHDKFPKDTIDSETTSSGHFYILWYWSKRKDSAAPYEHKEVPLTVKDLDAIIKRQREKLRTVSEVA